jgi:phosphotransferase system HPr (HPr) family protein
VPHERPLEEILPESQFAELLRSQAVPFGRLCNVLAAVGTRSWTKRHYYQLASAADAVESFLDDFGAKFNRQFSLVRELVASSRWLALAGFSVAHLEGRFESYGLNVSLGAADLADSSASQRKVLSALSTWIARLIERIRAEFERLGISWSSDALAENGLSPALTKRRLPRNVGQEELTDDAQRVAEVASKYLAACSMLGDLGLRRITSAEERRRKLQSCCREVQARVYEASVHNLQSTYDTYLKNTVVEGRDERLPRLRGYVSGALHLLEAATFLTHFVERHELEIRGDPAERVIASLVSQSDVQDIILNDLLWWANAFLQQGRGIAAELLPAYIDLQELRVELPENLRLHARPAALIVSIVSRYGTPVDMEVDGHRCNAGSILELLVAVGSHPDARSYVFRGDIHPLHDIGLLFEHSLGEDGVENLPPQLHYLRPN